MICRRIVHLILNKNTGISCVGIGKANAGTGGNVLLFGVPSRAGVFRASLWQADISGLVAPVKLTDFDGGDCQYVIQYVRRFRKKKKKKGGGGEERRFSVS